MCRLAQGLRIVRLANGFEGMGYRKAAMSVGFEPSALQVALVCFRTPEYAAAVDAEVICDPKVISGLNKLPEVAARTVARIEVRLARKLTRSRIEKIAHAYAKVRADRLEAEAAMKMVNEMVMRWQTPVLAPLAKKTLTREIERVFG